MTAAPSLATLAPDSLTVRRGTRSFARRAAGFGPSPWAEVGPWFDRHPDPIFFGNGAPAPELVPVARLREATTRAWADAPGALGYGDVAGYPPLRGLIGARMAARGMVADPETLVVTNGSQQGIDLIARLFLDPGDTVIVEGPSYLGALQVFDAYEAAYLVVPMDDQGLDVAALRTMLADHARRGARPPKLLYTIPTFQNPTGGSMSRERRETLLELARLHGIVIVEDDPYGELRYDTGAPEPALRALDPEVIYLGTFSKTIAPGLRVGWMALPEDLVEPVTTAKEVADINNERMTSRVVFHTARGFLDGHLDRARTAYRARRDALLVALDEHLPSGSKWTRPGGGFFVWVTLPPGLRVDRVIVPAADAGVVFLPGAWFYPDKRDPFTLRLSFSALPPDRIGEGIRRLGGAISRTIDAAV